jgi:hypothetical protein
VLEDGRVRMETAAAELAERLGLRALETPEGAAGGIR